MSVTIRPMLAFAAGIALGIGGTLFLRPIFSGASSPFAGKNAESHTAPPKLASAHAAPHLSAAGQIADAAKLALPAASSEAFADLIRGLLTDGNSNRRLARFQLLLEKCSPDHFRALLPLIRENDLKGAGSPNEWTALWQYWGGAFPQDALAAMQSLDSSEWGPGAREEAQKRVMRGWAEEHPQEALAFFESQAPDFWKQPNGTLEAVLKGWISTDPQGAATWLGTGNNPELDLLGEALAGIARKGGHEAAEKWFDQQSGLWPPEVMGNFAFALTQQKVRFGVDVAQAWIDRHKAEPWMEVSFAPMWIVGELASKDPQGAMEWAASLNNENGVGAAMDAWSSQDAGAASKWLHDHPDTPFYDQAAYALAMKLSGEDPEAAAAWAATIKDKDLKGELKKRQEALSPAKAP